MYAPHFLYASEVDYNDFNVKQEPKPESRSFTDIYTKLLDEIRKFVASQTVKVDADPEPCVIDKLDPEPELKVVISPIQDEKWKILLFM